MNYSFLTPANPALIEIGIPGENEVFLTASLMNDLICVLFVSAALRPRVWVMYVDINFVIAGRSLTHIF